MHHIEEYIETYRTLNADLETSMSEDEPALFSEAAEALIPIYPSMPNSDDVHPDLVGLMHKCWNGMAEQRPDATLARKITDATLKMYAIFLVVS